MNNSITFEVANKTNEQITKQIKNKMKNELKDIHGNIIHSNKGLYNLLTWIVTLSIIVPFIPIFLAIFLAAIHPILILAVIFGYLPFITWVADQNGIIDLN